MINPPGQSTEAPGKQSSPGLHIEFGLRSWPKRFAYLILWALFLFGSSLGQLANAKFGPPWNSYVSIIIERRNVLLLAAATVLIASRFRPGAVIVQALVLWLFIPIASVYLVYSAVRFLLHFRSLVPRLLTSRRVHSLVWPAAILAVAAILNGWGPSLLPIYLVVVVLSVAMLLAVAFLFAFSPGVLYRVAAKAMVEVWRSNRRDVEQKLESGEFSRDRSKLDTKISELTTLSQSADKIVHYYERAADPSSAIKVFVIILPFLFAIIVFLFTVVFLGLEHNSVGSFRGPQVVSTLDLFLFSLSNMLNANLSGVVPATHAAKIFALTEVVCAVSIVVVLLLVVTTISRERHKEELKEARSELQQAQQEVAELIDHLRKLKQNPEGENRRNA